MNDNCDEKQEKITTRQKAKQMKKKEHEKYRGKKSNTVASC